MATRSGSAVDVRLFGLLLLPSWLSGLAASVFGIFLTSGTIVLSRLGSAIHQSFSFLHSLSSTTTIGYDTQNVSNRFASNHIVTNVLFLVFWCVLGLIIYLALQGVITALKDTNETVAELTYINVKKETLIRDTIIHTSIRLISLILLWFALHYFVYKVVPYDIAVANKTALALTNTTGWLHTIVATLATIIASHIIISLVRLVFLRPRLIGGGVYN